MSGTSVDGIDAVIVEFKSTNNFNVIETQFTPFTTELREKIIHTAFNNALLNKTSDSPLHNELATHYAEATRSILKKAELNESHISAIANHGQTVKHEPNANPAYSLQLGNGQLIANLTQISTISEFRQGDLAVGGQGAPLMPAFHNTVFQSSEPSYILNLGGIANITQLGNNIIGFDTGPSNTLLDQWINKHQGKRFDKNGQWAESGTILKDVLERLLQDPYLKLPHPKSTGTDYYNLTWLETLIPNLESYLPMDIQATLLAYTVHSVSLALKQINADKGQLFVCGGGAQNETMINALREQLNTFSIVKTDQIGIPSDWLEAIGFAWLGYCYRHNIPSNLPSVTGANESVVLGKQYTPQ